MASRKLRFAIFGNTYQPKKSVSIQKILASLSEHEADVFMEREFYDFLQNGQQLRIEVTSVFDGNDFDADFVISMGGDGTFLRAASMVGSKETPILGINTGRLGFLADVNAHEIEHIINALYEDDFTLETRAVILVETDGQLLQSYPFALNDVAILKRDSASMISIRANINGQYLNTYQADGLVISTPTGSTAYSLSVGGPIIVPGTKVFSMTAVAPHSLNVRPIVLPDDSVIELGVESRSHNFLVAIDGRSEKCNEGTKITLRRAPYDIKVVKRSDHRYFNTLREKMTWGVDTR